VIALVMGVTVIAQLATPPALSPVDAYKRAVVAMRAIHDPEYLRFDVDERYVHGAPSADTQLASGLDGAGDPLKTIAAVEAIGVHYMVESLASEDLPGCGAPIHLKLAPTGEPPYWTKCRTLPSHSTLRRRASCSARTPSSKIHTLEILGRG
jgi:hypothetical protein